MSCFIQQWFPTCSLRVNVKPVKGTAVVRTINKISLTLVLCCLLYNMYMLRTFLYKVLKKCEENKNHKINCLNFILKQNLNGYTSAEIRETSIDIFYEKLGLRSN